MLNNVIRDANSKAKKEKELEEKALPSINELAAKSGKQDLTGESPVFQGSFGAAGGGFGISNGKEVFSKLGSEFALDKDKDLDYNTRLSVAQTGAEVLGRTLGGFKDQAVLGALDSLASWDVEDIYNVSIGNTEAEYGNWLNESEFAKNLREKTDNQIYTVGDDFGTVEYWGKFGQSLGYTGGIIAEMAAEQVALAYATGGTGNVAGLLSKGRLVKQAAFGSLKGVQEAYMNSNETRTTTYQEYISKGYDEEVAKEKANEAAALSYRAEVGPLMLLNALQFGATFGNLGKTKAFSKGKGVELGFSSAFEGIGELAVGNAIKNKTVKKGVGALVSATGEALEERVQSFTSEYGKRETLKTTLDNNLESDYINQDLGTAMLSGFVGGGFFNAAFKGVEKISNNKDLRRKNKQHEDFVQDSVKRSANVFQAAETIKKAYTEAASNYKADQSVENLEVLEKATIAVEQADYNAHLVNTANALQLDYIKGDGNTTAFDAHLSQMEVLSKAAKDVSSQDTNTQKEALELLQTYGILDGQGKEVSPGALDSIRETFEQNIKDSKEIRKTLESTLLNVTQDFNSALSIVQPKYNNTKHLQKIGQLEKSLDSKYKEDLSFTKLCGHHRSDTQQDKKRP